MSVPETSFDPGAAYEQVMGHWSRPVGEIFLDWLAPAPGLAWADIGGGSGAFAKRLTAALPLPRGRTQSPAAWPSRPLKKALGWRASDVIGFDSGSERVDARSGRADGFSVQRCQL